jgi:hypothetical protein
MEANMEMRRKERIDRGIKVRTEGIYALSSLREIIYLMGPRLLLMSGPSPSAARARARSILETRHQHHVRLCAPGPRV